VIETLRRTRPRFVFCVSPQQWSGLGDGVPAAASSALVNIPLLRSQVLNLFFGLLKPFHFPCNYPINMGPGFPSGYNAGSIPVTTEFFLISCDSNQVPKWFGTHYNLEVSF